MVDTGSELTHALRAIADADEADARRSSRRIEPQLMSEFRSMRPVRQPRISSRSLGLALVASLIAAIALPLWMVGRGVPSTASLTRPPEIATAFMPLPYSGIPMTEGHVVRLEVPRSALVSFGLAPVDAPDVRSDVVLADVIVGEDGLARAVRFVRAARAPGETP